MRYLRGVCSTMTRFVRGLKLKYCALDIVSSSTMTRFVRGLKQIYQIKEYEKGSTMTRFVRGLKPQLAILKPFTVLL